MATIKPGEGISRIGGSIGDHVYSSWKGRGVLRGKSPARANPASPRQATARAGTAAVAKAWNNDLNDDQRAQWNEAAQAGTPADDPASSREPGSSQVVPRPKPVLTGYDEFLRRNLRAIMTALRAIGNPILVPTPVATGVPGDLTRVVIPPIPINWALSLNGLDEDMTCGNVLAYNYNAPFSWEFWVWVDTTPGSTRFIAKMQLDPIRGYYILESGGTLYWHIRRWAGTTEFIAVSRVTALTGGWHHVVCAYDGSNNANGMHIYIDSVVGQAIQWNNAILGSIITTANLTFGSWDTDPSTWLDGRIDCIRNFNRNLIQADVNTLYAGGLGLYGGDPLADGRCKGAWAFCAGTGNTLFDISGLGFNATLRNMDQSNWVLGKVPCPTIPAVDQVEWDEHDVPVGSKIRIWIQSYDANVHKQHVATIDAGVGFWVPGNCRVANGASVPIASMPGHYLVQIDIISPGGNQSPPSNTILTVFP